LTVVRVEAPARLHMGMLAVAGEGARRFGGLGASVSRPAVVLEARPAPLLAQYPVPEEWRAVLVVPRPEPGMSGVAEEEAFRRLVPSAERSSAIAELVLTSLLPALVERDLEEFGAALTRVQQLVGDAFAAVQGGRFHPRASALVEALLRGGAAGAGQSSWGPAVYGVVGGEAAGRELARRMEDVVDGGGSVELVTFDNRGARVERS
jgi:beta-RFAP synthase